MTPVNLDRLRRAYQTAFDALLAERTLEGYWLGELSTSALSTATAVSALALVARNWPGSDGFTSLIANGTRWLAEHQNSDGGWGDTTNNVSNISTTMLCRAALHLAGEADRYADCLDKAEKHLQDRYGRTPREQAEAVRKRYGKDRTFAVPILMTSALAGLTEWREVQSLPFELACLPMEWFRYLRLPVVSYALPALIAVGQCVHYHRPTWNPVMRIIRWLACSKSLDVLEDIQPSSGGFLEAVPLTSFVTMSLASIGEAGSPVAKKAVEFLQGAVRPDGSWPIDSNLATWVTTQAVNALATAGELPKLERRSGIRSWLLRQQHNERHHYTGAAPGGWAWTDLPGGVPDADDTAWALLAFAHLVDFIPDEAPNPSPRAMARANLGDGPIADALPKLPDISWESRIAIINALQWLRGLQNADGGWPTFCRGWGTLPFDRSGTDLTAHVLRALAAWQKQIAADEAHVQALQRAGQWHQQPGFPLPSVADDIQRGLEYLHKIQNSDGSWTPLWFGNQYAPEDENRTYGTARVLAAYRDLVKTDDEPARKGIAWLLAAQNPDGGWGGCKGTPSTMEETALAVELLLSVSPYPELEQAGDKGLAWLVEQVEAGGLGKPSPIGFYFAKLWYYEKLYPVIFTVAALGKTGQRIR